MSNELDAWGDGSLQRNHQGRKTGQDPQRTTGFETKVQRPVLCQCISPGSHLRTRPLRSSNRLQPGSPRDQVYRGGQRTSERCGLPEGCRVAGEFGGSPGDQTATEGRPEGIIASNAPDRNADPALSFAVWRPSLQAQAHGFEPGHASDPLEPKQPGLGDTGAELAAARRGLGPVPTVHPLDASQHVSVRRHAIVQRGQDARVPRHGRCGRGCCPLRAHVRAHHGGNQLPDRTERSRLPHIQDLCHTESEAEPAPNSRRSHAALHRQACSSRGMYEPCP